MSTKVFIKITLSFNDPVTQIHFAPGEWELDIEQVQRLVKDGRGKIIKAPTDPDNFKSENQVKSEVVAPASDESNQDSTQENGEVGETGQNEDNPDGDKIKTPENFTKTTEPITGTPLPENTPERDKLIAAGVTTLEKLKSMSQEDLMGLDKIGTATVAKIGLFLAELK